MVASELVAQGCLAPFPGCCGIAISTGALVEYPWRGKGVGTIMSAIRVEIAKAHGFGLLVCTDVAQNASQRRILQKAGWEDLTSFENPNTGNTVFVNAINLVETPLNEVLGTIIQELER